MYSRFFLTYESNMSIKEETLKRVAKNFAFHCVRTTMLEQFHRGTYPDSKTGDYSDVKVVSPYGEIPWKQVSHINEEEMREFMKQVVNRIYTIFNRMEDGDFEFEDNMDKQTKAWTSKWDEPEILEDWLTGKNLEEKFGNLKNR